MILNLNRIRIVLMIKKFVGIILQIWKLPVSKQALAQFIRIQDGLLFILHPDPKEGQDIGNYWLFQLVTRNRTAACVVSLVACFGRIYCNHFIDSTSPLTMPASLQAVLPFVWLCALVRDTQMITLQKLSRAITYFYFWRFLFICCDECVWHISICTALCRSLCLWT